ncbi:MAG: sugar phosphate isomerase/epimerase, partial [Candidatus Latescibacteria bacterium]|nr:sugar phosphate isomerase/epimerase [Candidatus Latescibacterota bacterium]
MKLSLTSVMLPRWDLETTFTKLAEHGYDGIELRCRYNPDDPNAEPANWGRHLTDVSPDNIVDKAAEIRELSQKTGVRVAALAPNFTYDQTDTIEKIFVGAKAIDADNPPLIRIGAQRHDRTKPYINQFLAARAGFADLVEIARDHGVKVIYEIHVGTIAVSAARTIELLKDLDTNHIGAIWDVPNMIRVGLEDSKMGIELLGPYLSHCHIGNATPEATERDENGQMQWKWNFSDLREGM